MAKGGETPADPGRPPRAPAGSQQGASQQQQQPQSQRPSIDGPTPSQRRLVLEMPPTPPTTKAAGNGTGAAPATAGGGSARLRSATRLLGDSTPAVAQEAPRPPCYLEKASLWSVLTFGYVRAHAREPIRHAAMLDGVPQAQEPGP